MSRRKQSNPKPLKREDEEWGNGNEAMQGETRTPGSPEGRPASAASAASRTSRTSPPVSPVSPSSPATGTPSPTPVPRLRLNTSLATDPALAPTAAAIKAEPEDPPAPILGPRDYLAALPTALTSAIAAGLFPPPVRPDSDRPPPPPVPSYMCAPCGIRYSSLSTLEAHRTYYCSHRQGKPPPADGEEKSGDGGDDANSESSAKAPRVGKQYACTHCSYSADKKVSLNRHMRMHSSSPSPPSAPPSIHSNGDASLDSSSPALPQDRYCSDCDIRFSSTKTFRAHKTHYCSTRQVVKQATATAAGRSGSSCTSGSAPPSPNDQRITPPANSTGGPQQQSFLALPTNPILIVPYSLFRGASVLQGPSAAGLPSQETPCFLLPNGTIQPMTRAFTASMEGKEPEVLKSANRPRDGQAARDPSAPLDLSIRRSPESGITARADSDEHEKENRMRRSATPEQIVCAPSLPPSPHTPTPSPRRSSSPGGESSPKRRRRDSRGATPKPNAEDSLDEKFPPSLHSLLMRPGASLLPPELALRLAAELPGHMSAPTPQVLVKQGVSKCKECNIVFCKYENYLVHKRHYCSTRGGGEEESGGGSPAPDGLMPQYQQLICVACGIKFNSLDNLATHQLHYCTKRETRSPRAPAHTPDPDRMRCTKCKTPHSPGRQCPAVTASETGWKCPCCDVVSATAQAAQRHMEAHAGVKAFRCTICRYKGNTLRGMRTHIRMHFPKKPQDLQEESYISCVVEEEGSARESSSPALPPGGGSERVHRCSHCAYSSTYRGNVVRHARLVHPQNDPEPEEVDLEPAAVAAVAAVAAIKKEPEEEVTATIGPGPNYCKSCDISFKYVNTFIAHKKHYCSSHAGENAQANNNLPGRVPEASVQ